MKKALLSILLGVILFAGQASAELVKVTAEDGLAAVEDTVNDLTWLELTYTTTTIQPIADQMTVGGSLEGWMFASRDQVREMFASYTLMDIHNGFNRVNNDRYVAGRIYMPETDSSWFIGELVGSSPYDLGGYLNTSAYGWWLVNKGGADLSGKSSSIMTVPLDYSYSAINDQSSVVSDVGGPGALALIGFGLLFDARRRSVTEL